jgi:3-hydroxybutyryl-CoA dehydrogenase
VKPMEHNIKNVGIIGAGFMGRSIALQIMPYGYGVRIHDINPSALDEAGKQITHKIGKSQKKEGLGTVTFHNKLPEALKDTDLVIEVVPEKLELKKQVFAQIDKVAPAHTIIATNSSSIPVSKIEDAVRRKEKVLNLHFYPGPKIVDIMRGSRTSDETFEKGKRWVESIQCLPLVAKKECVGLTFNRVFIAMINDCLDIWNGDYADIEDIDKAWKIFSGMPLGPFAMMDWLGLDVVLDVYTSVSQLGGSHGEKPPQKLIDKVKKGELGRKTGKGFYSYG